MLKSDAFFISTTKCNKFEHSRLCGNICDGQCYTSFCWKFNSSEKKLENRLRFDEITVTKGWRVFGDTVYSLKRTSSLLPYRIIAMVRFLAHLAVVITRWSPAVAAAAAAAVAHPVVRRRVEQQLHSQSSTSVCHLLPL